MTLNFRYFYLYNVLIVGLITLLSACQKPPPDIHFEQEHTVAQSSPAPDLTQVCQNLKKQMQEMNDQRTTFALEQINQDIRICLPLISFKEQKQLLKLTDQMYAQFLYIERTPSQQEAFEQYVHNESQYPTIQQNTFEQLHIRDQYLLRHKGQAYIELMHDGKNHLFYRRNPQYFAKVFAPNLPQAEAIFLTEMANQNEHPLLQDNKLQITPDEILSRALFWENYLESFPRSTWRNDAHYLYKTYTTLLFKGLENQPTSENFDGQLDIQAQTLTTIEQLAEGKGVLANKAQHFLKFIEMTPEQRQTTITTPKAQSEMQDHMLYSNSQLLDLYLDLSPVSIESLKKRDCFSDAMCR